MTDASSHTDGTGSASNRPKGPGVLYAAVSMVMLVLVGVLALTVSSPPPPSIAEFAPQAVEQITDAPSEQGTGGGSGRTAGEVPAGIDPVTGLPLETPAPVEVSRVRQCVGDPPRQTEDPQSPPCVPHWEGDNGGETSFGVTGNEIRVALPSLAFESEEGIRLLNDHFNRRYEFYGRKIVLETFQSNGNLAANPNPTDEQKDAVGVHEEVKAFASLGTGIRFGAEHYYYEELARRKIVSVSGTGSLATEDRYERRAPYMWGLSTGIDTMMLGMGEFTCKVLAGKPPIYAGPNRGLEPERIFGIVYARTEEGTAPDIAPLRTALNRCGVRAVEREFQRSNDENERRQNATNVILEMSGQDVTTLNCWCHSSDVRDTLMPVSSAQGYDPEWLVSTFGMNDSDGAYREGPAPDQARRVFGLRFDNKLLPRQDMPWFWALREIDPDFDPGGGGYASMASRYSQLLLLASGIQLAGPGLTPESFAEGLHRARFPNPGAGGPPYYQARVGFEGRSQTAFSGDAAMIWYNHAQQGTMDPSVPGAICYVDHGARHGIGGWQEQEPRFFDRTGDCL